MAGIGDRYRMRLRRKRWLIRARWAMRGLRPLADRTAQIAPADILVVTVFRNEGPRLVQFLDHYRALGVAHFLMIDNASTDKGSAILCTQQDVSLWQTAGSYRRARYGMDWLMALLGRYGAGHWVLIVDVDELFIYPHCDTRPLRALTDWLDAQGQRSFGALLLDLYHGPQTPPGQMGAPEAGWFDPANYRVARDPRYGNLWVQGGPRARAFFADQPRRAPALNKIPLVRWQRGDALGSATHSLLPTRLNRVYATDGGERAFGCLLHTKLLAPLAPKAQAEAARAQHFLGASEYAAYARVATDGDVEGVSAGRGGAGLLHGPASQQYGGWWGVQALGLMSAADWL